MHRHPDRGGVFGRIRQELGEAAAVVQPCVSKSYAHCMCTHARLPCGLCMFASGLTLLSLSRAGRRASVLDVLASV